MKKFLSIFLFACIIAVLSANSSFSQGISVKTGLNLSNMNFNYEETEEPGTKMKAGLNLGVEINYPITGNLMVQSGIGFSQKGYSRDMKEFVEDNNDIDKADGYIRYTVNYIDIPINFAFKISKFYISAGSYVALGIRGKGKWDYTTTYTSGEKRYKSSFNIYKPVYGEGKYEDMDGDQYPFNGIDVGANLSVGYELGPFMISAKYARGFMNNIAKMEYENGEDNSDYINEHKMTNSVIQLLIGYTITNL